MSDEWEVIGKGTTTLDYLRMVYPWLGEMIDAQAAEIARLTKDNAALQESYKSLAKDYHEDLEELRRLHVELERFRAQPQWIQGYAAPDEPKQE